ncbi:hypothetical protein M514_08702 [Trichuris suis]|uniref:Uncharacterized protein n=1 Tax=Trichuris suis TaxID=68888 RepID=A0A085LZS9_9BILA|nr:hypothetical protein M513_08702 [Trichuris suis]KFD62360.1 hypothetical protein M514_08702 [Trichuris suis]
MIAAVDGAGRKAVINVILNGHPVKRLYDPSACYSVISEKTWNVVGCPKLREAPPLVAYTKVPVRVLGKADVQDELHNRRKRLTVYVVAADDSSLFGLDWCLAFGLPLLQGVEILAVTVKERKDSTGDTLV